MLRGCKDSALLQIEWPCNRLEALLGDLKGLSSTWMNLKIAYEVKVAEKTLTRKIEKEVLPMAA